MLLKEKTKAIAFFAISIHIDELLLQGEEDGNSFNSIYPDSFNAFTFYCRTSVWMCRGKKGTLLKRHKLQSGRIFVEVPA